MTTSLAYEELLAFEGLQDAVDQLYRAYLDAMIVEVKRESASVPTKYWEVIREFRSRELDRGTPPEYPDKAMERPKNPDADEVIQTDRKAKAERNAFLYWFDVRARFWLSDASKSFALDDFPLGEELALLYAQATALKARLERLKTIYEKRVNAGKQAEHDNRTLEKLQRQVDSAAKYSGLVERVIAAHSVYQDNLASKQPKRNKS